MATSKRRPSARSTGAPRYAASGPVASVAHIATTRRSGGGCAAGARGARARRRRAGAARGTRRAGRPPPREVGLAEEPRPSTPSVTKRMRVRGARDVLEAHLVADGPADRLAELLGHAPRGEPRGEAPRLEDDDLAAVAPARRRAARAARAWSSRRRAAPRARASGAPRSARTISGRSGSIGSGLHRCDISSVSWLAPHRRSARAADDAPPRRGRAHGRARATRRTWSMRSASAEAAAKRLFVLGGGEQRRRRRRGSTGSSCACGARHRRPRAGSRRRRRRGRRALGRARRARRRAKGGAAWSALAAFRASSARRRSRTSARTGRR